MGSPSVNIAVNTDVSAFRGQMQSAASAVQSAAGQMTSSANQAKSAWSDLATATMNANEASKAVKDTLKAIATGEVPLTTRVTNDLAVAQMEAAAASRQLATAQQAVKSAMSETNTQMASGYAQATLLSNTLGLRLGRGMEQVISRSPAMSSAMNSIFPLVLATAFGEMVFKLGNDVYEWGKKGFDAAQHISEGFAELTRKEIEANDQIFLTNAKLQQQIDKLEKTPNNDLAVALAEAAVAADKLADHLRAALEVSSKLLKDQAVGAFKGSVLGLATTGPAEDLVKDLQKQQSAAEGKKTWAMSEASTLTGKAQQDAILKAQTDFVNEQLRIAKFGRDEAKRLADEAQAQSEKADKAPAQFRGSHGPSQDVTDYSARIAAFRGIQGEMGAAATGMGGSQLTESLNQRKGLLELQKEQTAEAKRTGDEEKKQRVEAEKLVYLKNELKNNGLRGNTDALTEMPDGPILDHLNKILEIVKSSHKELATETEKAAHERYETEVKWWEKLSETAKKKIQETRELADLRATGTRDKKLGDLGVQETQVKGQQSTGQLDAGEALRKLKEIHAQELEAERQFIADKLAIDQLDKNAFEKDKIERQKIEDKWCKQALADDLANLQQREQKWREFTTSISHTLTTGLNSWIQGQKTFTQAMKQEWNDIAMDAIRQVEKIGEHWIEEHILMAAVKKLLGDDGSLETQVAQNSAANVAMASSDAATAGAATLAYYSMVSPEVAPEMAAAQYGIGMGFATLATYDYGGVVPKTHIAMVHEGERVLTPSVNNVFERLISQSNSTNTTNSTGAMHASFAPTIHALDGTSVARVLRRHNGKVFKEISRALRMKNLGTIG